MFFVDNYFDCIWENGTLVSFIQFPHKGINPSRRNSNAKLQLFRSAIADFKIWEIGCAKAEKWRLQFRAVAYLFGPPLQRNQKQKRAVALFGCRKLKCAAACFWYCPIWAKAPDSSSCLDPATAAAPVLSNSLSNKADKGNYLPNANGKSLT